MFGGRDPGRSGTCTGPGGSNPGPKGSGDVLWKRHRDRGRLQWGPRTLGRVYGRRGPSKGSLSEETSVWSVVRDRGTPLLSLPVLVLYTRLSIFPPKAYKTCVSLQVTTFTISRAKLVMCNIHAFVVRRGVSIHVNNT